MTATGDQRRAAAHGTGGQEIDRSRSGGAILYQERTVAPEMDTDQTIAADFRDTTATARGEVAHRRLGLERYQDVSWRSCRD